ncbi:type II secretion system F family protein [Vibrio breoganii]
MNTNSFNTALLKFGFGLNTRIGLYKKISAFVEKGVPIHDTVTSLRDAYLNENKNDGKGKILDNISNEMTKGKSFGEALSPWVPPAEAMIIVGGESSGNLKKAFDNAINVTNSAARMKSTIIGGLSYPMMLVLALFILIYFFAVKIIPPFADVLDPELWPDGSKKLYALSMYIESSWWHIALVAGLFAGFASYTLPKTIGKKRDIMDKFPPWSIYKTFQGSVFLVSTAALMGTGRPIYEAIELLKSMSPPYVKDQLEVILQRMTSGQDLGIALNSGFLDKEVGMEVQIYGATGKLDGALEEIGNETIESGIAKIAGITGMLRGMAILGIAGYMGWVFMGLQGITNTLANGASAM